MTDLWAFCPLEQNFVRLEGVEFRSLRGPKVGNGLEYEEFWEEVEVSDDEAAASVARAAPLLADVATQVLELVSDLSDKPVGLETDIFDDTSLDSINIALLVNKIQASFQVMISFGDLMQFSSVQAVADHIVQNSPQMPASLPTRPRVRRTVRRKRLRPIVWDVGVEAPTDCDGSPTMEVGSRVRLVNLNAHLELSGTCGVLVAYHLAEHRWQVRLDNHAQCKLLKEANLEVVDLAAASQGLVVLNASAGTPQTFLVHSLVGDLPSAEASVAGFKPAGHVCALLYDEEAQRCDSLASLAALYVRRVLEEYIVKEGDRQGPPTLAGCCSGIAVAHEMAVQLQGAGVEVNLLFFGTDLARPTSGNLSRSGRDWFGGELEAILLLARLAGAREWADREEHRLAKCIPKDLSSEDLAMRAFWELLAERGAEPAAFASVLRQLGSKLSRIHSLVARSEPKEMFRGPVNFVLGLQAAEVASHDLTAMSWDGMAES
mmetsp:Transcript_670/g.2812  ORF Transcript_670/g.2812 Transcript_670/m.2812 type:complete len:489 (-) Transcript_670:39-1505(-)|eukprot:CAMPEP_0204163304 /NCGR_PEP_ID=MMETSP0361-20130328/36272_1 /ASSEMBLY_ACC=CAM_ASM_000343 /TAXON_ID=268821 /ORGANISM="Scrippsiella Hangoei, Strain SHTV-5" /LENGTH=488 /DNA_ID=CAMNT_0051119991 /DNA_START=24 /DNA_END=1487 /DNA_ORIENTATION=+